MTFRNYSLGTLFLLWLLIAIAVLVQMQFYPLAHFGYSYYGNAYNMWVTHSYWYPSWHHTINVQKPPLFYWLTLLGWWLFGLNHLIMPSIVLISYLLLAIYSAKTCLVFTQDATAAKISGMFVLVNLVFLFYINLIRFDIQLALSVMLAFYALSKIICENRRGYWGLYSVAIVLGLLFKGPVIYVFTLPMSIAGNIILPTHRNKVHYSLSALACSLLALLMISIWLIPANYASHGHYVHEILQQTLQRLDHSHPDPYSPEAAQNFHWWYTVGHTLNYLNAIFIMPFVFILPIFCYQLYQGIQISSTKKLTLCYFAISIFIPLMIFSIAVGLVRYRYVYPLIPIVCIAFAYVIAPFLRTESSTIENRCYRGYLILLSVLAMILCLTLLLPVGQSNHIFILQIVLSFMFLVITSWSAHNWQQRWQRFIFSMICCLYLFVIINCYYFHSYPTVNRSAQVLQQIKAQKLPVFEVISYTRRGWPQFLGQNMHITALTFDQFQNLPLSAKSNSWVVFNDKLRFYQHASTNIYPLQFSTQQNHAVPILMPYTIYQHVFLKLAN